MSTENANDDVVSAKSSRRDPPERSSTVAFVLTCTVVQLVGSAPALPTPQEKATLVGVRVMRIQSWPPVRWPEFGPAVLVSEVNVDPS